jgi:hypothetical protein
MAGTAYVSILHPATATPKSCSLLESPVLLKPHDRCSFGIGHRASGRAAFDRRRFQALCWRLAGNLLLDALEALRDS